jgi:hypothetical protein
VSLVNIIDRGRIERTDYLYYIKVMVGAAVTFPTQGHRTIGACLSEKLQPFQRTKGGKVGGGEEKMGIWGKGRKEALRRGRAKGERGELGGRKERKEGKGRVMRRKQLSEGKTEGREGRKD